MDCLGQLCSIVPCLWECSSKHVAYIRGLEDNLNSLRITIDELNNLYNDVKNRVNEAEEQRMKRRNQVNGWLDRVEAVNKEVNQVLENGGQELKNKCVGGCCPRNCRSSYKLSKKVTKMIPQVKELTEKGRFDVIADQLPPPPVDEQLMEGPAVGFESNFEKLWKMVQDKDSSIIGLVGGGGVGKTTLLKQLNNELSKTNLGFDLVIWIVVSRPTDLEAIRNTIRNKLNISNSLWENKSKEERISLIYNKFKGRKVVVLLDDLWDKLKLSELGIPVPQHGVDNPSKVVFTTRLEGVCGSLDAHKIIKVGCLPPEEALNLFKTKVGEDVLKCHPELQQHVKDVASECAGLPLALITIGRAMRDKTDAQQWKDAKRMLEKYPATFQDIEGEVFSKLLLSYDCLPNPIVQKCFEYCSIFPEDYEILIDELIEHWIAERIIDEYSYMYDARIQGRRMIDILTQACLLEKFSTCNHLLGVLEEKVKMHDVIRDMALWLVCDRGKKNKFRVNVIVGDHAMSSANKADIWKNAERASVWRNTKDTTFKSLARLSGFSNLVTLIIKNSWVEGKLSGKLFQSMKVLKVLNLSNNKFLTELPVEIGGLLELEYLNIRLTSVRRLPKEVKQLKKLRFLLVGPFTLVSGEVTSSLESLQVFENCNAPYTYRDDGEAKAMEGEMLQGLEKSKRMMDLCIKIRSVLSIQILFKSQNLQSCTRHLSLCCGNEPLPTVIDFSTTSRFMEHLERFYVWEFNCSMIKFCSSLSNLRQIQIYQCPNIRNLSTLVYLRNLCALDVLRCDSLEELIGEDDMMKMEESSGKKINLFPYLISLTLDSLPKLRSICPQSALPFPSLKKMRVGGCNRLKKLPFDSSNANTIHPQLQIVAKREWWDSLQWDTQQTKDIFAPKFM